MYVSVDSLPTLQSLKAGPLINEYQAPPVHIYADNAAHNSHNLLLKVWWQVATLFVYFHIFYNMHTFFNHIHRFIRYHSLGPLLLLPYSIV
jgi:hypothetical protein